jgi:thymidylate synthase
LFGYTAFEQTTEIGHNQFLGVVETLKKDKDSRQAICHINLPSDVKNLLDQGTKDFPCTLNLAFFIREDKLHLIVTMRSNDAVTGFTVDLFQFTMMQEMMLCLLKSTYPDLELGYYYHTAYSMHLYERNWEMANSIVADYQLSLFESENIPDPVVMQTMEFLDYNNIWDEVNQMIEIEKQIRHTKEPEWDEVKGMDQIHPYWQNFIKVCFDKNNLLIELEG